MKISDLEFTGPKSTLRSSDHPLTVLLSVMASFTVQRFGLASVQDLTFPEITQRFGEFKKLTHFEDF